MKPDSNKLVRLLKDDSLRDSCASRAFFNLGVKIEVVATIEATAIEIAARQAKPACAGWGEERSLFVVCEGGVCSGSDR